MVSGKKRFKCFLDKVPDEKLESLPEGEKTLYLDWALGYRLDHQGLNDDGREGDWTHRVFVQPIGSKMGAKTQRSNSTNDPKAVVARCHSQEGATASQLKKALLESYGPEVALKYAPARDQKE